MKIRLNLLYYLYWIFCLVLIIFLSACKPAPESPLRIGTNTWPGYEPLYLARTLGYYDNSRIHLVEMNSASEVIHSLRSGTLEGAALTLDEALTLQADDFDLKIILVMDFSHGADVLLAKPDIDTLAALKGKRIAVEYTAVGAILLDAALASADLTVSDIQVIACSFSKNR
ncbi:MAG: ABC transporter substrate-binding protein [gamma proteobacterium symbiont of Bathyaustriella thionipta]|nr:ABC transporter substrate-binding protein [gamma proteobacterium symbiont of Bathyaustriella thionipta]MCU7949690.1 ABC transporter substrate-binding protein [gamma proteobacterium symbiont of Bathyaustriella thionipta]MCU7952058.1 ABC transporter substrate-binding protein [gamma proteobacterium symbiont of Bathyaustriella thionipta]MCU7956276.1 ABC transporter substrate-binding protein [gamma proteobacterium symbiont of Bathyaustriella thionipta]MCU7968410.1 ABC transporter substrate-bindin